MERSHATPSPVDYHSSVIGLLKIATNGLLRIFLHIHLHHCNLNGVES